MRGPGRIHFDSTTVSQPAMVPANTKTNQWVKLCVTKDRTDFILDGDKQKTQADKHENGGISLIRECLICAGLPKDIADIIMQS